MPPKSDTAVEHATFFLNAFHHLKDGKVDWAAVAADNGISHARNASSKFAGFVKQYGYEWKQNKLTEIGQNTTATTAAGAATAVASTPTTRKKTAAAATKGSTAKKRKVEEDSSDNVTDEAISGDDED